MDISRVYIGGWFQRTTLHLSEIYDFVRDAESGLALDTHKLRDLQQSLDIASAEMKVGGLERIALTTKSDTSVSIFEDGLIVLSRPYRSGEVSADIKWLTDYYESKLSPALSYLFSLGAPVPKELANIKTIYPYFVVVKGASKVDIERLLKTFGQHKYLEVVTPKFDIYRGDKFYIINNKKEKEENISRFIEEQIFLREFKGQLHRYLTLHRVIWERIAEVKERGEMRGQEISGFKDKVEGYAKTINLIEGRMGQMSAYLHTRERIAKEDKGLTDFLDVIEYRYETLGDTLDYMRNIWQMTKNYVGATLNVFTSLQAEATQNSVKNLAVITSMGVGGTLLGLLTRTEAPNFTYVGIGYFAVIVTIGYLADWAIRRFYRRKSYKISDIDYDKDIK